MAAVAGGLALGVVGSRLLPPLVAGATGSLRASMGHDPFQRLVEEHRSVLSMLDRLIAASEEARPRRMALFLGVKRSLAKHALAEEDVVYPILQTEIGDAAAAAQLYKEHGEMKVHLYQVETALKRNANWAGPGRSLHALIERHARDEEDVQFPRLQAHLDKTRTREVGGQIHREEAMIL
jgi:iron-sulfur cluster repair protein YtfE (RIC family)